MSIKSRLSALESHSIIDDDSAKLEVSQKHFLWSLRKRHAKQDGTEFNEPEPPKPDRDERGFDDAFSRKLLKQLQESEEDAKRGLND